MGKEKLAELRAYLYEIKTSSEPLRLDGLADKVVNAINEGATKDEIYSSFLPYSNFKTASAQSPSWCKCNERGFASYEHKAEEDAERDYQEEQKRKKASAQRQPSCTGSSPRRSTPGLEAGDIVARSGRKPDFADDFWTNDL